MHACIYVTLYFMTLIPSTYVDFHKGNRIYRKWNLHYLQIDGEYFFRNINRPCLFSEQGCFEALPDCVYFSWKRLSFGFRIATCIVISIKVVFSKA